MGKEGLPRNQNEDDEIAVATGYVEEPKEPKLTPEQRRAKKGEMVAMRQASARAREVKEQQEEALGETLGNDIWEKLQKLEGHKKGGDIEEGHIPEEISQIYGDQTPPLGVLELYKRLDEVKRADYLKDLRIFEEKNKQQETSETAPMGSATVEPLVQVETKPGLAIGWQPEKVPLGRVMPRVVPTDIGPLIQVETKKIPNEVIAHTSTSSPDGTVESHLEPEPAQAEKTVPTVEKERKEISLGKLEDIVREQLKGKAKITGLHIFRSSIHPYAMQLHAELDAGMTGGKIVLNGMIVNNGNEIGVQDLDIEARGYVKSMIEGNLSSLGTAIKTYFEKQHGKPVTSIQIGENGLTVEFENPLSSTEEQPVTLQAGDLATQSEDSSLDPLAQEGTPKEWREKLRGLIDGAKEKLGMSELGEKLNGFLSKRSGELDAEAGKMGKGEKLFRTLGEKYNKLPMWQKVALGGSLAVGYGFTLPISSWLAGAYALPLFVTRVAAMAGSFENNRKLFETINKGEAKGRLANTGLYKWLGSGSEKNRENKAMAKALIQSFGMTLGLSYVAHEIAEHHVAERIGQWMVEHMPSKAPEVSAASRVVVGKITEMPGTTQPAAVAAAGGKAAATAAASEIPGIEVTATPGHGYEYMLKRLWEQHIKLPENANPDSDLAQLLRADEKTIDGVVHRLAQDNEFFKGDGTSARINLDSKLTIDTNGQIWLDHENILAPEGPVTPAFHAEAPSVPSTLEDTTVLPEVTEVTSETNPQPFQEPVSELAVPTAEEQNYDQGNQVSVEAHETPISTPASVENVIPNKFGLTIPTAEPHIYANEAKSLFVYGGSAEQKMKMITEYLTKERDAVVYAEDMNHNRVPWLRDLGGKGKIIQGPIMRTSGLASIFSSFMKAPSPDDLKVLVK